MNTSACEHMIWMNTHQKVDTILHMHSTYTIHLKLISFAISLTRNVPVWVMSSWYLSNEPIADCLYCQSSLIFFTVYFCSWRLMHICGKEKNKQWKERESVCVTVTIPINRNSFNILTSILLYGKQYLKVSQQCTHFSDSDKQSIALSLSLCRYIRLIDDYDP